MTTFSTHPRNVCIVSGCAALLLTGCMKLGPLSLANPEDNSLSNTLENPSSRHNSNSSLIANNSATLIANNSASLSGQLQIPDPSLISNNSASLTNVGGGAFYRFGRTILALDANPLANAVVSLIDGDGKTISSGSVQTDAQGHYAFNQIPPLKGPLFVKADFSANGKDFSFMTLLPTLTATETIADIDVASTLVAEKSRTLLQQKTLDPKSLSLQKIQTLIAQVRSRLIPGLVPFMARNSMDIVPTLDQLTLDNPEIQQAASMIASSVAAPLESWQVSTPYRRPEIQTKSSFFIQFTGFEADREGNLYFWDAATSPPNFSKIWKLTPAGAMSLLVQLPVMPASITAAPDGTLYVVGIQPSTQKVVICHVVGTSVSILPGYLAQLGGGLFNEAPYGRLAIDDAGNLYAAYKRQHVIMRLASGSVVPEIFAGTVSQPGYADGQGASARFNSPMSPVRGPDGAIYVADSGNNCIRRIALNGIVSTYVGQPNDGSYRNGRGAYARFGEPNTLVLDAHGNCIISDSKSLRVRRISPDGSVFLLAGSGASGSIDGSGPDAAFVLPQYLAIDGQGKVYVLDKSNASPSVSLIRVISKQ